MADTRGFFEEYLPNKMKNDPDLAKSVDAIFQFNIEGAGSWALDLTGEGTVTEGTHDKPDCTLTAKKATWEAILDKPSKAIQMVMMGKLKIDNLGLATSLQKILS